MVCAIQKVKDLGCFKGEDMKTKIILSTNIFFIEGNRYSLFVESMDLRMPLVVARKEPITDDMVNAFADSLRAMGAEVEIEKRVWDDPNFETKEEAMEYLANKGW